MRMGGGAKPFGVDAARVPALVRRIIDGGADWRGFHIFAGSQALDADALIEAQAATLALAAELAEEVGATPPLVNLGGGFGIPYFHGEQPLDVEAVGAALGEAPGRPRADPARTAGSRSSSAAGWSASAGVYLTRIVDRKVSHGKTFLVTDGGMHHQLAASRQFRPGGPPQLSGRHRQPLRRRAARRRSAIVGCLCTPLDRLADDVMMPRAEVGDLVAVFLAGAYGLSASPQAFLGQQPALRNGRRAARALTLFARRRSRSGTPPRSAPCS